MNYKPRLIVLTFLVGSIILSLSALLVPADNTSSFFQWAWITIFSCHFFVSAHIMIHQEKRVAAFSISSATLMVMLVLLVVSHSLDALSTAIGIAGSIALCFTLSPIKARQ